MRTTAGRRALTDEALVLRTHPMGEADRIVVLLTREHGRVDGVARGARRLKNRFGASLEPLSRVRAVWRPQPNRDLVRIDGAELLASPYAWLVEPANLEVFARITRLVGAVSLPGEANEPLFRLLGAVVDAAPEVLPAGLGTLELYVQVWLARLEGFWPDLAHCGECGRLLDGVRLVDAGVSGALCRGCGSRRTGLVVLGPEGLALHALMARQGPGPVAGAAVSERGLRELGRVAGALLSYHLERNIDEAGTRP